ncbi:Ppx/GppA phosphatase family protein [Endozoicomonas sp. ONNA2]|uniref:Ppx/GppA phosphatase family protein n=1 Tax=Endozoicomonas sp. ONNA2 TaxID=2828741 RepID=UPI002148881B|nr:Ppx/GppA phosphatase family protein [Endozoicomonas sp. ONNA2]
MTKEGRKQSGSLPLVAAIDLGSNSFHMIVARVDQGEIRPVERLGKKVQLAAGLNQHDELTPEAMMRGFSCLEQFAQYLSGNTFQAVRVVGTNALRKARNSDVFVGKAQSILGYPVEIIAGREEARLIYLGVAQTQSDDNDRRLVMDIGGGSTEFVIGERFEPKLMESLHMGCVVYTDRFFGTGELTPQRFQSAYYAARLELLNIEKSFTRLGWVDAVGSSGSIRAVSSILQAMGERDAITRDSLEMLKLKVLRFNRISRVRFSGLKPDRQAIFPAGLAILMAGFDALGIERMHYSDGALREGVLHDMLGRDRHEDVRERTINALMSRYHVDEQQAFRVMNHTHNCFAMTADIWGLGDRDLELLSWAARVCQIGLDISHTQYHRHGAYLIDNSDLMGFSKREQQQLALLVRGHRRSISKSLLSAWPKAVSRKLMQLIILLRIANVLSHGRDDTLPEYSISVSGTTISVFFPDEWLEQHPLTAAYFDSERSYMVKIGFKLMVV